MKFFKRRYDEPNRSGWKWRLFSERFGERSRFKVMRLLAGTSRTVSSITNSSTSRAVEILDLECGEFLLVGPGEYGVYVWRVWGEDEMLSPWVLEEELGVEVVDWVKDRGRGESFGVLISSETFEDIPEEVDKVLRELRLVLGFKRGG